MYYTSIVHQHAWYWLLVYIVVFLLLNRRVEKKVRALQYERGDYKGWSFIPYRPDKIYVGYYANQEAKDHEANDNYEIRRFGK